MALIDTHTITTENPELTVFEQLAGVFVDGTDPADIETESTRLIDQLARFDFMASGANADVETEAWLAGQEV